MILEPDATPVQFRDVLVTLRIGNSRLSGVFWHVFSALDRPGWNSFKPQHPFLGRVVGQNQEIPMDRLIYIKNGPVSGRPAVAIVHGIEEDNDVPVVVVEEFVSGFYVDAEIPASALRDMEQPPDAEVPQGLVRYVAQRIARATDALFGCGSLDGKEASA